MSYPTSTSIDAIEGKPAYKRKLAEAIEWLQREGYGEKAATTARIYRVNADSIRTSIKRRVRRLHKEGQGGHNKILLNTKIKVIEAYYYEQWELGIGATK